MSCHGELWETAPETPTTTGGTMYRNTAVSVLVALVLVLLPAAASAQPMGHDDKENQIENLIDLGPIRAERLALQKHKSNLARNYLNLLIYLWVFNCKASL